jgi:hypothetical protein
MTCPGSAALEAGEPDSSNDYSDEGTAAHFLASECLVTNTNADGFTGQVIGIFAGKAHWWSSEMMPPDNSFTVDDDMANYVNVYLHNVRQYAEGGILHVEQRMPIGHLTGEKDAAGTADAVVIQDGEIIVVDLKYGMREVNGERNKQLMIYALAALEKFCLYGNESSGYGGEFDTIRTVIIQPRIGHFPEWSCTVDELLAFGAEVRRAANECHKAVEFSNGGLFDMRGFLVPGDHCRKNYCKARATCPALSKFVTDSIGADFENLSELPDFIPDDAALGDKMNAIPMIEDWCKAVRAKVEGELFSGRPVPGYKLVQGKKGNRQWTSKEDAESVLKGFKLKVEEMYDLKVISPTTAEKLAKAGTIGPRQWPKLQGFITQSEGSPSVAPESDKRPALEIKPAVDDFDNLTETDYADMI